MDYSDFETIFIIMLVSVATLVTARKLLELSKMIVNMHILQSKVNVSDCLTLGTRPTKKRWGTKPVRNGL